MAEFISLLVSFLIMAIADSVDTAFGNSIGIDAVIVIGCLSSFSEVVKSAPRIGAYSYRVMRSNDSECIVIDCVLGSITGIIMFLCKDLILSMYSITQAQRMLLNDLICVYAMYVPCHCIGNAVFEICRLKGELKFYRVMMILFYTLLISSDAVIYYITRNLPLMYVATAVCQVVVFILYTVKYKVKFVFPRKQVFADIIGYGMPICIERIVNSFGLMLYGVIASRMDNVLLSIHTVCYGAAKTAEQVTNAYNAALMIKLPVDKSYKEASKDLKKWMVRMLPIILPIFIVYSIISIFIYHGSVSLKDCFPWYVFYMLEFIGLFLYENGKVFSVNRKVSKYLPYGCIIGFIFRLSVSVIGLYTTVPLIFFGIGMSFDWGLRGIFYFMTLHMSKNKQ